MRTKSSPSIVCMDIKTIATVYQKLCNQTVQLENVKLIVAVVVVVALIETM